MYHVQATYGGRTVPVGDMDGYHDIDEAVETAQGFLWDAELRYPDKIAETTVEVVRHVAPGLTEVIEVVEV